ncbi:ankyrin repeat-containing domain protein [Mycena galopus ATCC 62051]|nr:ankyrin repeat-containing domain protein [Mycena galopus ATCC 62051]
MVRLLVEEFGVDVNAPYRSPALYAASRNGHDSVARFLLEHGAEPDVVDLSGKTALHAAASEGHISVMDALLRHGASVNARGAAEDTPLGMASSHGNVEAVRRLLEYEHGADVNLKWTDKDGCNALWLAVSKGHTACVKFLVENGADINLLGGWRGTALHAAWKGGGWNMFRFLLENGADVNAVGPEGTILHELCTASNPLWIRQQGHSACSYCVCQLCSWDKLELFTTNQCCLPSPRGKLEECVLLLIKKGANVNAKGGRHGTPLSCAAFKGRENVCRILIEHGADVNLKWTGKDGVECDALRLAACGGHETCFNLLVKNGADINLQHETAAFSGLENISHRKVYSEFVYEF